MGATHQAFPVYLEKGCVDSLNTALVGAQCKGYVPSEISVWEFATKAMLDGIVLHLKAWRDADETAETREEAV